MSRITSRALGPRRIRRLPTKTCAKPSFKRCSLSLFVRLIDNHSSITVNNRISELIDTPEAVPVLQAIEVNNSKTREKKFQSADPLPSHIGQSKLRNSIFGALAQPHLDQGAQPNHHLILAIRYAKRGVSKIFNSARFCNLLVTLFDQRQLGSEGRDLMVKKSGHALNPWAG